MQKNAPFILGLLYAALLISSICISFYGGYIKYVNVVYLAGVAFMLPFIFWTVWLKKKRMAGNLSGREGVKEGLRFVVAATLYMALFQAIFFELDFKQYKIHYIENGVTEAIKKEIASGSTKVKDSDIPNIIEENIKGVTLFWEITAVFFKNLLFGAFSSFLAAVTFKRKA